MEIKHMVAGKGWEIVKIQCPNDSKTMFTKADSQTIVKIYL